MDSLSEHIRESPKYIRMSLAAAMTLGFRPGLFYRGAKLFCINLLLTYRAGCAARCSYCGLSNKRPGGYNKKSFIRVTWPTYTVEETIESILKRENRIKRICISMITNKRSVQDTKDICALFRSTVDIPVSLLISPTILNRDDLLDFKAAGADKIGVAIDLATSVLFDKYRGAGVGGPHRWETYVSCLADAIDIFGKKNAGSHFMVGMGETERDMVEAIQAIQDMGGWTHLFSFFPEADSVMSNHPMPSLDHYRRIQLARYLIDEGVSRHERFVYQNDGRILDFGVEQEKLDQVIDTGEPFRTSGCQGYDGQVACNRPFANSRPGPDMRNYPFPPDENDILRIREQMGYKAYSVKTA
jgi:biotin synthase